MAPHLPNQFPQDGENFIVDQRDGLITSATWDAHEEAWLVHRMDFEACTVQTAVLRCGTALTAQLVRDWLRAGKAGPWTMSKPENLEQVFRSPGKPTR